VSFFASASRFVYVSSQVFVGRRVSSVGGESPLFDGFGEGCGEYRDRDGAGEIFARDGSIVLIVLGFGDGGLPQLEGDRS
jgi:hypothetical protein